MSATAKQLKAQQEWKIGDVKVSDHAVLRYLEIKYGMDTKKLREEILADGRYRVVQQLKTCKIPFMGQGRLIAQDGIVVTIIMPKGYYKSRKT